MMKETEKEWSSKNTTLQQRRFNVVTTLRTTLKQFSLFSGSERNILEKGLEQSIYN